MANHLSAAFLVISSSWVWCLPLSTWNAGDGAFPTEGGASDDE